MREMGLHSTSRSEALRLRRRAFKLYELSDPERAALAPAAETLGVDVLFSAVGTEGVVVAADSQLRALGALLLGSAPELAAVFEQQADMFSQRVWTDGAGRDLLEPGRTTLMGILNVTPDSFSDGGRFNDPARAEEQAARMIEEGADIIDVGGLSTRPGAEEIPAAEELARILPTIARIARNLAVPLSVDTYRAEVAEKALDAGATIVNDISGFSFDAKLASVCARKNAAVVLMHTPAKPAVMMEQTTYRDLMREVRAALGTAIARALAAGIPAERIAVDPGFGFGKTAEQGWEMLRRLGEFGGLGHALLVGVSRKSMFRAVVGDAVPAEGRDVASGAAATAAVLAGAHIVRTHNVKITRECVAVADQLSQMPRL
jgi:dihydropteroate synthase